MSNRRRRVLLPVLLTASLAFAPAALADGGSPASASARTGAAAGGDSANATKNYNTGLKLRDKAWKYEEKAAEATDARKKDKYLAKAQDSFRSAVERLRVATRLDPDMHQAHSSLGYALRKMGDYRSALRSYDKALELEPQYAEAIEYRAEAYLGLGRVDEAKEAYLTLVRLDAEQSATLLQAMEGWLEVDGHADAHAEFASWVAEQRTVAGDRRAMNTRADW